MATAQSPVALSGQTAPPSAFDQLFGMAAGIGLDVLQAKGQAMVAREVVKNDLSKQAAYTKLSQQSPNLGPNDNRAASVAAMDNTELRFGITPAEVVGMAKRSPVWMIVALAAVAFLVWKAFR